MARRRQRHRAALARGGAGAPRGRAPGGPERARGARRAGPRRAAGRRGGRGAGRGLARRPGQRGGRRSLGALGRRVAQRPAGSGAARVLARVAAERGVAPGAGPAVATHADAARAVLLGAADAAVVIEPVAEAFGLPFHPLCEERFELLVRRDQRGHPGVVRVLDALAAAPFGREVAALGAYALDGLGGPRAAA
ncbi:MAG: substrate-binding domain-containing protein [Myxococcota bacterium]